MRYRFESRVGVDPRVVWWSGEPLNCSPSLLVKPATDGAGVESVRVTTRECMQQLALRSAGACVVLTSCRIPPSRRRNGDGENPATTFPQSCMWDPDRVTDLRPCAGLKSVADMASMCMKGTLRLRAAVRMVAARAAAPLSRGRAPTEPHL